MAYAPLVVAILDAGMTCTAVLPAPAEMGASLHISGTGSSILDSVFVCRRVAGATPVGPSREQLAALLVADCVHMAEGGVRVSAGDVRCLANGRLTALAISRLGGAWTRDAGIDERLEAACAALRGLATELEVALLPATVLKALSGEPASTQALTLF